MVVVYGLIHAIARLVCIQYINSFIVHFVQVGLNPNTDTLYASRYNGNSWAMCMDLYEFNIMFGIRHRHNVINIRKLKYICTNNQKRLSHVENSNGLLSIEYD